MSAPLRFPQGPMVDRTSGFVTFEWQQWLQNPEFLTVTLDSPLAVASGGTGQTTSLLAELQMAGPMYPATPTGQITGAAQVVASLWAGSGAPSSAWGRNGDFYFRSDGSAGAYIYQKAAGAWGGIV